MKNFAILLTVLTVASCNPKAAPSNPNNDHNSQGASPPLLSYQASEFEPSWSLKLTDGTAIEFRRLDAQTGAGMVTETYRVTAQKSDPQGWSVTGDGEAGTLTFKTKDVSVTGGCTHSGSGLTHRDTVTVQTPTETWGGCGGPEI